MAWKKPNWPSISKNLKDSSTPMNKAKEISKQPLTRSWRLGTSTKSSLWFATSVDLTFKINLQSCNPRRLNMDSQICRRSFLSPLAIIGGVLISIKNLEGTTKILSLSSWRTPSRNLFSRKGKMIRENWLSASLRMSNGWLN